MTFIAYAPGLQPLTYDFSKPSETFETFSKIAEEFGIPMHNLNYQDNERMPTPSEGGARLVNKIETLQQQYGSNGIWIGNSVGGHMMLEASTGWTSVRPDHVILYGPVLGVQSKIVELATMQGPQAVAFLDGVINGKGEFPVPVAGGGGAVPIGRDFFSDRSSFWVRAFNDERLAAMQKEGFSQATIDLFKASQEEVAALNMSIQGVSRQKHVKAIGVTILAGEKDMYCHAGDLAAFTRDVAPQATVIKMPGDHEWQKDRKDFFRAAIAPFSPKRPAATAKPAEPDAPKA